MRFYVAVVVLLICASSTNWANAELVYAISYDMPNGGSGAFNYRDDSYTGTGDKTMDYAPLAGGLGDLTDGVIATENYGTNAVPYVGWQNLNPTITFNFGSTIDFESVTIWFDDTNGAGGVTPPSSVNLQGVNYLVTDPAGSAPFSQAFDVSGLAATNSIQLQINRQSNWFMISEVQFVATPEPSSFVYGSVCLLAIMFRRQRRAR